MNATVCVVSRRDVADNPRVVAAVATLGAAGHDVRIVSPGAANGAANVVRVPSRRPAGLGPLGMVLRRLQPSGTRKRVLDRALVAACRDTGATYVLPGTEHDLDLAVAAAAALDTVVIRPFGWADAGQRDLISVAPTRPDLSASPAGRGVPWFSPEDVRDPWLPAPGRHRGVEVVVVYSGAETSPGAYLVEALRISGAAVHEVHDSLDWSAVPPSAAACVIVESPYPAFDVVGVNPGVPVLFWVHHGEHHLAANVRLAARYAADAVLLAHSWHLGPWFGVPVHRFPFATAPWMMDATREWAERDFDVAMVGAGVATASPVYPRRAELVSGLSEALGSDRTAFASGVTPAQMLELYANARIVINDGGTRHAPITMRIFEAVGSGAALATDPVPGLEQLLPTSSYAEMTGSGLDTILGMLEQPKASEQMAADAHVWADGRHTYAHRVDELLEIAARVGHDPHRSDPTITSGLAAVIDQDVEVQRIATFGASDLRDQLPGREIVAGDERRSRMSLGSIDAVAVGAQSVDDAANLVRFARRFAYVEGAGPAVATQLDDLGGQASVSVIGDITRIDFNAPGYRRDQLVEGAR